MKHYYETFIDFHKKTNICDFQIDTIHCSSDSIRFVFQKGFSLICGNKVERCPAGYVELSNCNADEFSCHIIRRKAKAAGARLSGKPISLSKLANMLAFGKRKIEIFLELYDSNYLYWRGVLLPHKKRGLSDQIVLETSGNFPITCFLQEDSSLS